MKHITNALVLVLFVAISNSAYAQGWQGFGQGRGNIDPAQRSEMLKQRLEDQGITLPSNWDTMTQEEKRLYMQDNGLEAGRGDGPRRGGNGQRGQNMEERLVEQGITLPSNWEDMSQEGRRAFAVENGLEGRGEQEQWQEQRPQKNFLRNARKANKYQKFTGQLQAKKQFNDDASIRRKEAVTFLQQRGIVDGNADGSFNPQGAINRAESLKVLLEALGEQSVDSATVSFYDVPADAWYTRYINRARQLGIVKGYQDGTFRPGNVVNQVELLKIAFESFGIDLSDYPVSNLPIGTDSNAWYATYLQYALDNNLLDEEIVNPGVGMTREEFSEVIYRLIQQQESL